MAVEAAPNTYKLDEVLKDMIQAVYSACSTATAHLKDDEKAVDKAMTIGEIRVVSKRGGRSGDYEA